jgi:gamma-tubulin complex component 2
LIDVAEDEIMKNPKQVSKEKMESFLDLALRGTAASNDPYKDDIFCYFDQYNMTDQLYVLQSLKGEHVDKYPNNSYIKALDYLTIDLKVSWPTNLILSRACLVRYQLLFRVMLFCRWTERQLNNTWINHQTIKEF